MHHIVNFNHYRDKSVASATKGLINFFRDVNPALLEKKDRGKLEALEMKTNVDYGQSKISKNVDGLDLLAQYEGWTEEETWNRVLSNEDFKKIKVLKLWEKAKKADKSINLDLKDYGLEIVDPRFKEPEENDDEELLDNEEQGDVDSEEGEEEFDDEGEEEEMIDEEGEEEFSEHEDDNN